MSSLTPAAVAVCAFNVRDRRLRSRLMRLVVMVLALVAAIIFTPLRPPLGAASSVPPNGENLAMEQQLRTLRTQAGVRPLRPHPSLIAAARGHAAYLALDTKRSGHSQTPGLPGFTGVGPLDRTAAAGYPGPAGEVVGMGGNGRWLLDELMATVFHRILLLDPEVFEFGFGGPEHRRGVINLGYDWKAGADAIARWPYPGQQSVIPSWNGLENPDPAPDLPRPYGYPVTISYPRALIGSESIRVRSASLDGPGGPVALRTGVWGDRHAWLLPHKPLDPNSTYRVAFEVLAGGRVLTEQWGFHTATEVGLVTSLRAHAGEYGRLLTWEPPASGPPPSAYRIQRCGAAGSGGCQQVAIVEGDQHYWFDPEPSSGYGFWVDAYRDGYSISRYVWAPARPGQPLARSKWITQSPYPVLRPGEVTEIWFAFRNSGTAPWVRGQWGAQVNLGLSGDNKEPYRLGMNVDWPWDDRAAVQSESIVRSGEIGVFRLKLRAPSAPGVYRFGVRPVMDGTRWLDDEGVFLVVTVR